MLKLKKIIIKVSQSTILFKLILVIPIIGFIIIESTDGKINHIVRELIFISMIVYLLIITLGFIGFILKLFDKRNG